MEIPKITLNNDHKMPSIGIGTWQLKGDDCIESIETALELGYTHIDTAEFYANEEDVGQAIKQVDRNNLFITTKIWPDNLDYVRVLGACEQSLSRLESPYIDLYLIHWPDKNNDLREILKAFKELVDDDKIKSFGVSNFTINHLKEALPIANELGLKISVNQVEFHPFLYQKELLDFCTSNNIILTAYSPLARGKVFENQTLIDLGKKYNKSAGQVSLKWMLEKNIVVIPKASSEEHMQDNLNILDFEISREDMDIIDNLNIRERLIDPSFAEFDE